jgi:F-type H+-transporting ATPase subunit gamma
MASLKSVKNKISAVKKTKQITKAMNMVAASRLRGAQTSMDGFRPYAAKFAEVLSSLAQKGGAESNALLVPRETVAKVHIVLMTSDRGLCGGFNANLINRAEALAKEKRAEGKEVSFTCFGRKGRTWARKFGVTLTDDYIGIVGAKFGFNVAATAARKLVNAYLDGASDEIYLIFAEFVSMAKQIPVTRQLLPIPPMQAAEATVSADQPFMAEHICEPSAGELLGELLPRSISVMVYSALLETSTSEHAARMAAMDNATKACNDMIGSLTLAYNKARQSAITADLMDIVGGAEALKG